MLKRLLMLSALLLPINSASAQTYFDPDYNDPYDYSDDSERQFNLDQQKILDADGTRTIG